MTFRSFLYKFASLLGDINAISKGHVVRRVMRKSMTRTASRIINRSIK